MFTSAVDLWPFNIDNTILIDDSLKKSVCNRRGNAIFLELWSCHHVDNNFLMDTLAPWLNRMNVYCAPSQFRTYIDQNQIGCPPLVADDPLLLHMMHEMALLAKNVGIHYNVIGVLNLNCA